MGDKPDENGVIRLPPTPPKAQSDGKSQWMEWRVVVGRAIRAEELKQVDRSTTADGIVVSFEMVQPTQLKMVARQTPIADYTDLYYSSLRGLFHLEALVGALQTIEGEARARWNMQFVFARRFGALD